MHAHHQSSFSFLSLPPEIRHMIYLEYFRSLSIGRQPVRQDSNKHSLAILRVCRLIHREAQPLAIPNLQVTCYGNADVIDVLSRLGPTRITQLRYLRVWHFVVGFKLFPSGEDSQRDAPEGGVQGEDRLPDDGRLHYENDESDWEHMSNTSNDTLLRRGVQYFHLGAVLGLFPGLQLDLLQVHSGVSRGPFADQYNSDCFGSLLAADGYRRLWMDATGGDYDPWVTLLSLTMWRDSTVSRFHPYSDWRVWVRAPSYKRRRVDELQQYKEWKRIQAGRITLMVDEDNDGSDYDSDFGPDSEETMGIEVDRGDADFAVKRDDLPVLKCLLPKEGIANSTFYQEASDALRKLFQESSWETIKTMDGFYDGADDSDSEGTIAYDDFWE